MCSSDLLPLQSGAFPVLDQPPPRVTRLHRRARDRFVELSLVHKHREQAQIVVHRWFQFVPGQQLTRTLLLRIKSRKETADEDA